MTDRRTVLSPTLVPTGSQAANLPVTGVAGWPSFILSLIEAILEKVIAIHALRLAMAPYCSAQPQVTLSLDVHWMLRTWASAALMPSGVVKIGLPLSSSQKLFGAFIEAKRA